MKSYTDLEQSKKLAEILPLESADFHFSANQSPQGYLEKPIWGNPEYVDYNAFPCWSLVALLSIIKPVNDNSYTLMGTLDGGAIISFEEVTNVMFQEEEIIDAVVEMVCWLKENKIT